MAGTYCPINSGDPAVEFAAGGYSTFMGLAPQTFEQAVALTNAIGDVLVNPVDFQVSFDFDGQLTPFQRPIKPTLDPSRFEFNKPADPAAPPAFSPGNVIMDAMPVFNVADPVLQYGTRPSEPNIAAPAAPGPQADLVMPAVPTFTLPPLPTLSDLNLPSVPAIVLPQFEGQRPVFVEPPLADNWSFSTTEYVSQFLDQVKAKVSSMMDGNSAWGPSRMRYSRADASASTSRCAATSRRAPTSSPPAASASRTACWRRRWTKSCNPGSSARPN